MRKNTRRNLFFLVGMILMFSSFVVNESYSHSVQAVAEKATEVISRKAVSAREACSQLLTAHRKKVLQEYPAIFRKEQIGLYLFKGDSLIAWNNAQIPFAGNLDRFDSLQGMVELHTGYYYYTLEKKDNRTALALVLIKPRYEFQNRYLSNDFPRWLNIPSGIRFSAEHGNETNVRVNGKVLFSLQGNETAYVRQGVSDVCFVLFLAGIVCLLAGLLLFLRHAAPRPVLLILLAVLLLRVVMLLVHWPAFFYNSTLFDVRLFGNARSLLNGYLGDMFINSCFILFFCTVLGFIRPGYRRQYRVVFIFFAALMLLFTASQFNQNIISLVNNSTLNFNLLDFINVSPPAFVGLFCLALLSLAVFQLLRILSSEIPLLRINAAVMYFLIVTAVSVLLYFFHHSGSWVEAGWLIIVSVVLYPVFRPGGLGLLSALAIHLLIMSGVTSLVLNGYMEENQKKDLELLSQKLGERQDPVLENEFAGIPEKIQRDTRLQNLFHILPSTAEAIEDLLDDKYFSGYFKRYTVIYSLFDSRCAPMLETANPLLLNEGYFEDQIIYHGDTTMSSHLYFVQDYRKNARYIGKVAIGDKRLYILMEPKQFEELGSFPDLLLDESQQRSEKLKGFSYAVYRSSQNTSSFGSLNYPPFLPDSALLANFEPDHMHRFFAHDDFTSIVISRPEKTWRYFFTYNSYVLLLFSLVCYLVFMLYALVFTRIFSNSSLTRRIQAIIIVLLLMAISAVGLTSARLVREQFARENKDQLREKTEIIYTDLTANYDPGELFDRNSHDAVNAKLNEYARLFNTDVSLFDHRGFLYATSQPRLYSLGLSAGLVHPLALQRLGDNLATSVSINERAGDLSYMSLYTAIYNKGSGAPAGYINLPYFARQDDLVSELSGIVSGLVNVYVILFVISIGAGLILAGYITRPLRLIQQQIAGFSLGKRNEKIDWQGNDELGRLVGEYNQMLVKLEESAALLAQSERESAWREMAKQVAHEIKNPLTPMKLNLQYLQHLMKSDPADFREKFTSASAVIIEQIDSLANIANEFSHFAKLPQGQVQSINIAEVIRSSALIFENRGQIRFRNMIPEKDILVAGDHDQCLRVFNNLFANAVQALQETDDPWIEISRLIKEDKVIVQVRDNGSGIDEELKSKIFTPNFTTKNAGSGLGLAMVKNIIEGFGGRIWFESEKGLGTSFYLEFRKA